ncbi:MAG: exodeoxyribonuclease I [Methylococcaceae bacterium]|nr:exodeoxyribonuclease I [Methylococcaceae bacterium]
MNASFYWHDYETFGIDPQQDRASQFAGIRTDLEFNIIDEPLVVYCRLAEDCLPSPEACLITGITPQRVAHGLNEAEFIARIHEQLARPQTCGVGYNSIRFDDEVTRNLLYRNFYDPYAREWQQQNSRWDLIDLVRACHALRPEGINWPVNEDGVVSLKLEALSKANHIIHEHAHDALSDVYATIAMAQLIKRKQAKLLDFALGLRNKHKVLEILALGQFKPLVHISGRYPNKRHNLAVIVPLCAHPFNDKEIIVYDLSVAPEQFLALSSEELRERLFSSQETRDEALVRLPIKTLHINKCPFIAPINVLRQQDCQRLNLDLEPRNLAMINPEFKDPRLATLWFRYKARNWPESLDETDKQNWRDFCGQRLHQGNPSAWQKFNDAIDRLETNGSANIAILQELRAYADSCSPENYPC